MINPRNLIEMTKPEVDPVIDGVDPTKEAVEPHRPEQVEPTGAPRYTAGSGLRSLKARKDMSTP